MRVRGLIQVAAVLVIPLAVFSGSQERVRAALPGCPKGKEIDYAKPLSSLPSIRHLPGEAPLPNTPKALRLESIGQVFPGGGPAGIRLTAENERSYRLGWTLSMETNRVNARGAEVERIDGHQVILKKHRNLFFDPVELITPLPSKPGYFRIDLAIRDASGRKLNTYSEYVRVTPKTADARLIVGPSSVKSEEMIFARIENRGTLGLTFGLALNLEMWNGSMWVFIPHDNIVGPVAIVMPGGAVSPCMSLALPSVAPGRYRLSSEVGIGSRKVRVLHAPFSVF